MISAIGGTGDFAMREYSVHLAWWKLNVEIPTMLLCSLEDPCVACYISRKSSPLVVVTWRLVGFEPHRGIIADGALMPGK